jgi:choline kinase
LKSSSESLNADYQVIILAAGRSLRLKRLTQDLPKSLLRVEGQTILGHALTILASRGLTRLTLVVGYRREKFIHTFGNRFEGIEIEYVANELFAESEHGYSLFCALESWRDGRQPVVFMDADNLFDPAMLDSVMESRFEDVMLVDDTLETVERDEELVLGRDGVVSGLYRGRVSDYPDCVGGFVGINRFSAKFMGALFNFMLPFFAERGRMYKYERVFDAFIKDRGWRVNYVETKGLPWINVNDESDYEIAKQIARKMKGGASVGRR